RSHGQGHSSHGAEPRDALRLAHREEARLTARTVTSAQVFRALLKRDFRVAMRELPFFLLRTTLQPLMFVTVFGFLLPRMGFMGRGYTTALLPGVLAIS